MLFLKSFHERFLLWFNVLQFLYDFIIFLLLFLQLFLQRFDLYFHALFFLLLLFFLSFLYFLHFSSKLSKLRRQNRYIVGEILEVCKWLFNSRNFLFCLRTFWSSSASNSARFDNILVFLFFFLRVFTSFTIIFLRFNYFLCKLALLNNDLFLWLDVLFRLDNFLRSNVLFSFCFLRFVCFRRHFKLFLSDVVCVYNHMKGNYYTRILIFRISSSSTLSHSVARA